MTVQDIRVWEMFTKQRLGASADQDAARAHLLLNFTDLNNFDDRPVPVMVRGDGCEVIDSLDADI